MSKEPIFYGGQAVIGGVLINSPKGWSLAVRDNHGEINRYFEKREPLVKRNSILGAPFIRGVAALLDSLIVGYRGIDLSDRIVYDQDNELTVLNKIMNYLIVIVVLFLLIGKLVPAKAPAPRGFSFILLKESVNRFVSLLNISK